MGSEDEVEFAALKTHVLQVFRNAGLKALLDELRQIQQGPNGRELLPRLIRSCDEGGVTLLHQAAELFGAPLVDYPGVRGTKPYSREEFSRRFAEDEALALTMCRFLVDEAGADVNFPADGNMAQETALERTIVQGCEPIAKFLLERGADNHSRVNALWYAADFADHSMLKLLLENGADVNDLDGNTALTNAAKKRDFLTVERLMAAGIDINRRDASGKTAAKVALSELWDDVAEIITAENQQRLMQEAEALLD
ncbi:hypothetical protein PF005_g11773 [Phytophthora fragariae]|uniref:Uncharacterized protein n=1 Tax=Phytophthora fragariae TaxID=53985 RepID=A0A6A3Z3F1_9STRA|nr:hypothetical protein PF003_g26516 [Phytophthora fragariae]KAE8937127.1 hypothetical protein PF009_g12967 [Phytophthora fragariae]KAE9109983.1 hypothetical protein PF007_g12034 [Phytophthora fragariae]KAE9147150.1 hypothetical protein PF006_g8144 [Phytophthora fragariae]KAE9209584.1 hypothetical protein PF005_g11773 [Phytophthora fragariae]